MGRVVVGFTVTVIVGRVAVEFVTTTVGRVVVAVTVAVGVGVFPL